MRDTVTFWANSSHRKKTRFVFDLYRHRTTYRKTRKTRTPRFRSAGVLVQCSCDTRKAPYTCRADRQSVFRSPCSIDSVCQVNLRHKFQPEICRQILMWRTTCIERDARNTLCTSTQTGVGCLVAITRALHWHSCASKAWSARLAVRCTVSVPAETFAFSSVARTGS